ncbi:hypothetical protein [Paenibacillus eucommiae]|uniref:Uncharacterized protein n=1 Tax=Paenibacillus eucommiae TaxID=1355755 RepID=A0ABS4IPZ7_9BACL|nr:hypothetical protein [Paenibacillus eucommiae]MBP1989200.1 hypothetical protein [Paenibacillus eucommiae]
MSQIVKAYWRKIIVAENLLETVIQVFRFERRSVRPQKDEHMVFLEMLFDLLPRPLPHFEEKIENPNILAWTDKSNGNIL